MRPAAFAVALLLTTTTAAFAADCTVAGDSAMEAAGSNEFGFSVDSTGGTECFISRDSVIASASSDDPISCDVSLFTDGEFHPDWTLTKAELLGSFSDFDRQPTGQINFSVGAEAGETGVATLKSVTLSGPDCDNWQEAFSGAPEETESDAEDTESDAEETDSDSNAADTSG